MDQKKLNEILDKHSSWLRDETEGTRANLCGADLYEANLCGADLRGADLYEANLYGANLCGADLYGADLCRANLCRANLCGADLCRANLCGADLRGADLYGANLCEANLYGANLYGANLYGADLYGADLCRANLCGADLYEANLCGAENVPYIPMACPDTGEFIAWKKAYDEDEDAYLSIEPIVAGGVIPEVVHSKHDKSFTYKVGQTVVAPDFDTYRFNKCAPGIHFFINRQEAIDYFFT